MTIPSGDRRPFSRPSRRPQRPTGALPNDVRRWAVPPTDIGMLDASAVPKVPGVVPLPTVYVKSHLLVSKSREDHGTLLAEVVGPMADAFGWGVEDDPVNRRDEYLKAGVRRYLLTVLPGRPGAAPDAFVLLQHLRAKEGVEALTGVGLDHLMVLNEIDPQPYHMPLAFDPQPYHMPLSDGSGPSGALASYLQRGSGARQPVAYVGPRPPRRSLRELGTRRPVVAILDSGCGTHPWFEGLPGEGPVVDESVMLDSNPIGHQDPATDPEQHPDLAGPLDGEIDQVAGHGTFIAGLIHQTCPDADILSWRVVPSSGPVVEYDILLALAQITDLAEREANGQEGGRRIDVLSLSMGYYHETPQDLLLDPTMLGMLDRLSRAGVVVVVSAGNDGTSRPMFPAAFAPWRDGAASFPTVSGPLPVVSVGALNPNLDSDALFSNAGPWVRSWTEGASVLSTLPAFAGGLEPVATTEFQGRVRAAIDPDDFSGGFAVWSGTSFSAPVLAGRIAARLLDGLADDSAAARVDRAVRAVTDLTDIV